jgi:hypothetical protein
MHATRDTSHVIISNGVVGRVMRGVRRLLLTMRKKKHTIVEREGINFTRTVVEQNNCIFHEIHKENDFGNDAFFELVENENVRGICLAAQIKSGESYCSGTICRIPADREHFEYWSKHSLPVIGIVYDPREKCAYWINITNYLRSNNALIERGPYTISFEKTEINKLDIDGFQTFFLPFFLNKPVLLAYDRSLAFAQSDSFDKHSLGIRSLLYGYRNQEQTWDDLIRIFRERDQEQTSGMLIYILAHIPGHPDIFWHSGNIIDENLRKLIKEKMSSFSRKDIEKLLDFVGEEGFGRGTIGQSVDAIISIVNDSPVTLTEIIKDESVDSETRQFALVLYSYYEGEGALDLLDNVIGHCKELEEMAREVRESIRKYGFVYLY